MAAPENAYELERQERIASNKRKMEVEPSYSLLEEWLHIILSRSSAFPATPRLIIRTNQEGYAGVMTIRRCPRAYQHENAMYKLDQ